jgi:hypothetical protein
MNLYYFKYIISTILLVCSPLYSEDEDDFLDDWDFDTSTETETDEPEGDEFQTDNELQKNEEDADVHWECVHIDLSNNNFPGIICEVEEIDEPIGGPFDAYRRAYCLF